MRILTSDQAVLDHVAARREAIIGRTIDWANINSGSRNAAGLNIMLDVLEAEARRLPAVVERIPTQGSITVASLMANYDFSRQFSVQLNVSNLFDKNYFDFAVSQIYYGAPRKFVLTAKYDF